MNKTRGKKLRIATESLRKLNPDDLAHAAGGEADSTIPIMCGEAPVARRKTESYCGYCC